MKERPILFSAPMIHAILAGQKTQTRRIFKEKNGGVQPRANDIPGMRQVLRNCPYGQHGDQLWVRETWQHSNSPYGPYTPDCTVFYRADYRDDPHGMDGEKSPEGKYRTWIPSIHMPRKASRLQLEVIGIRVEKLHDISESDCIAEGAPGGHGAIPGYAYNATPQEHYRYIWTSINSAASWDANPWVWVVEFKHLACGD